MGKKLIDSLLKWLFYICFGAALAGSLAFGVCMVAGVSSEVALWWLPRLIGLQIICVVVIFLGKLNDGR